MPAPPAPSTIDGIPADLIPLLGLLKLPKLDNTLGAILLGAIFGFMLYGLVLHQTYRYYRMYPGDRLILKILSGTSSFYAGRVYIIGPRYRLLVALAHGISVSVTSSGIWVYLADVNDLAATVKVSLEQVVTEFSSNRFHAKTIQDFSSSTWIVSVAYGLAVLCDLITASALILSLHRSRTGFKRTDTVVDALVMYTVNTGLLTTAVGLLIFVAALRWPDTLIYGGLSIPGVKLYSNSVLAMLNSRKSLSARLAQGFEAGSFEPVPRPGARPRAQPQPAAQSSGTIDVLETWCVRERGVAHSGGAQVPVSLPNTVYSSTQSVREESDGSGGRVSGGSGRPDGEERKEGDEKI
ncbi:hypothetical protein C8Q77DRAFT_1076869 [Trametes polyzona]|nr:hypothetical protein C8Q77DRAFT_1076869 [Trametes polyzona]